jgi:twitching motility protein PilI
MTPAPDSAMLGMEGADAGSGADASRLGMQLGEHPWLLELADVSEVMPVPELQEVPFTQRWFAGVACIRGSLIGVVDLNAFFGGAAAEDGERSRLVIVADSHRVNCGLLFDRVIGLRTLDSFVREPDALPRPAWIEGHYRDAEAQRWSALSMQGLVTHPDFLRIERPASP